MTGRRAAGIGKGVEHHVYRPMQSEIIAEGLEIPRPAKRDRYSSRIESRLRPTMSNRASGRRSSNRHHSVMTRGPILARLENAPKVTAPARVLGGLVTSGQSGGG